MSLKPTETSGVSDDEIREKLLLGKLPTKPEVIQIVQNTLPGKDFEALVDQLRFAHTAMMSLHSEDPLAHLVEREGWPNSREEILSALSKTEIHF